METAVRELLIEKRLFGADEIRRQIEVLDFAHAGARRQGGGARLGRSGVQARLLANGRTACEELGISFYDDTQLIVLENTEKVHNLIVCTLCSCYPRPVLGLPPDWYKLKPYRARAVIEPRAVLAEFGTTFPTTSRSASAIPPRWCVIWCCRCGPRAPRVTTRNNWPRWSRATR